LFPFFFLLTVIHVSLKKISNTLPTMSVVRIALSDNEQTLVFPCRRRSTHIVSHLESPGISLTHERWTYAQVVARFNGHLKNTWVLRDVHIVDHNVVVLMALLRLSWSHKTLHVTLVSPSREASEKWARYIASIDVDFVVTPVLRHSTSTIEYAPLPSVVYLSTWIRNQVLKGDVLVFTSSSAQKEDVVHHLKTLLDQTVVSIHNNHVPFSRTGPRILVGTYTLDYLLSYVEITSRVQHVVDFGTIHRVRQDTGNDWEETFITETMALRRLQVAGSKAPGVCLRMYHESSLRKDVFATHRLQHDLCRAKLRTRCGDTVFQDLPLSLSKSTTMTLPIANLMNLLHVEMPVAKMIHKGSCDLGVAVAAVVARHPGSGASSIEKIYHECKTGKIPPEVYIHVQKWATRLGKSRHHILKVFRTSSWEQDVLPLIWYGYSTTMAVHTKVRGLCIDTTTGDVLTCKDADDHTSTLVYTHRLENQILSMVSIPDSTTSHVWELHVTSPLRLKNDLQKEAVHAHFQAHHVVASCLSETDIHLWYGKRVSHKDLHKLVQEWTDMMKKKAMETPILVPLNHGMHLLFTAGLRFSDAITTSDFIVVGCEPEHLTHKELLYLDTVPGNWCADKPALVLPKRDMAQKLWTHLDNMFIRPWTKEYHRDVFAASTVSAKIVVRTYTGKSTGRALICSLDKTWVSAIQESWGWNVADDNDTITTYGPLKYMIRVSNIPLHMDEIDVAELLQLEPHDISLERITAGIGRPLPCVMDFFHQVNPLGILKTSRTSRYHELSMDIREEDVDRVVSLVYDTLPTRNELVNQPLRVCWLVSTSKGSHPPNACPSFTKPLRIERIGCAKNEQDLVRFAFTCKKDEAERMTPSFAWLPSLHAPWISIHLPGVESSSSRRSLFRIYGTPRQKQETRRALHQLALHPPPPPPPPSSKNYDTCPICFEPHAFFKLTMCGCAFCVVCLATTFEKACLEPDFTGEMLCPSCRERVCTQDLEQLVSTSALETFAHKVARFLSTRIPHIVKECPARCGTFSRTFPQDNVFVCLECRQDWCATCSETLGRAVKSHKGFCAKHTDSPFWKEFAAEALEAGAKACPVCETFVVKDGGCNHITCQAPHCHTHFCWKCAQAYSHQQTSPYAKGVIVDVQDHVVVISILPETWTPPCMAPCPTIVHYKREFAQNMLLENETLQKNANVWVYSYIYDHIDACVA
jgi:hypothetical protein